MRILAITYEPTAGPGVFADAGGSGAPELDLWLRTADPAPPRPPEAYDAVLCLGGAMHADQDDAHPWLAEDRRLLAEAVERDQPVLGVCLGAQILTQALGGEVFHLAEPEIGWYGIELTPEGAADPLLGDLAPGFEGFEWHSYSCSLPAGAVELARTPACLQAYRLGGRTWAIQFHAEVTLGDAESWIDDYLSDPDAVRMGLDPEAVREQTRARIGAWNRLGRGIWGRFLELAARLDPA